METSHVHTWGPISFTGEPRRECSGCSVITLDLYLYCEACGEALSDPDTHGKYHHIDYDTGDMLPDFDHDHDHDPETGEAPYDEDEK
jgi:hypothetical protein